MTVVKNRVRKRFAARSHRPQTARDRNPMYTDTDNTGLPIVPQLTPASSSRDRRETMEEEVWSHLIETPTEEAR
ncbi:hypothetical protein [Halalkalicoccus jeotgali]|nr:hypothetical protein [Halalkalicoccus jeotgali]